MRVLQFFLNSCRNRSRCSLVGPSGTYLGFAIHQQPPGEIPLGFEVDVQFEVLFDIDYSELIAGTHFSIVEGPHLVALGEIK